MVILQHSAQIAHHAGSSLYDPALSNINLGRFGVVLFFLISGFVIPFSFKGERPLRTFATSRFFRLYPAYWLSMPFIAGLGLMQGGHLDAAMVLANMTMVQMIMGVPHIGMGYWTLNMEIGFYAICAVLFARGRMGDVALVTTLAFGALALSVVPLLAEELTGRASFKPLFPFYLSMFFLGLLLRRTFVEDCQRSLRAAWCLAPFVMLSGAVLGGAAFTVADNANDFMGPLPLTLGMVLPVPVFVLVLMWRPQPPAWLLAVGTVSYALYLFQDIGLLTMAAIIPAGTAPFAYMLAVCASSTLIAAVVYWYVERPMIALGKRVSRRWAEPRVIAGAA